MSLKLIKLTTFYGMEVVLIIKVLEAAFREKRRQNRFFLCICVNILRIAKFFCRIIIAKDINTYDLIGL